jgi:caffeoyl-CoA O-methyltransferase
MLNVGPSAAADCLDVSEEFTSMAVRYWHRAQLSDRIQLHLGPATDTLPNLKPGYDLAFVDADKPNYPAYFEACLKLVRQGGLILVDNVLWDGKVADPEAVDEDTSMFRQFNDAVRVDPRVDLALIPIADGLTICRVR